MTFFDYIQTHQSELFDQFVEHINLTVISLIFSGVTGITLGILISRYERFSRPVLGFAGILQTIPSIALLGFLIPIMGIGYKPALFALYLYSLLPIIRNTLTGINQVDSSIKEAAHGMGLSPAQVLFKVELPLAAPVIFAGIRTAAVISVGVATLAAYIGAGGLGEMIFGGIAMNNSQMILAGAIPASILAVIFDGLIAFFQKIAYRKTVFAASLLSALLLGYMVSFSSQLFVKDQIIAGFEHEFTKRPDGYPGLQKTYGLDIPVVTLGPALLYDAIKEREVDVISGYATDGRIKGYDLKVLKDDRSFFPPYHCAFIVNQKTLKRYPQIESILNQLSGKLTDSIMTQLNYKVDYLNESADSVAIDFLKEHQLWKGFKSNKGPEIIIGSKIFTEQYILTALCKYLIEGSTDFRVTRKNGLGGTKICFSALQSGEIDLYPEYTGTGLQVILKAGDQVQDSLNNDSDNIYQYVSGRFNEEYTIKWLNPLGFNNTYALMMRKEQADELEIESISDLVKVLD